MDWVLSRDMGTFTSPCLNPSHANTLDAPYHRIIRMARKPLLWMLRRLNQLCRGPATYHFSTPAEPAPNPPRSTVSYMVWQHRHRAPANKPYQGFITLHPAGAGCLCTALLELEEMGSTAEAQTNFARSFAGLKADPTRALRGATLLPASCLSLFLNLGLSHLASTIARHWHCIEKGKFGLWI